MCPNCAAPALMVTRRPPWEFGLDTAHQILQQHFGVTTLEGFGLQADDALAVRAAGAVISYLRETQKSSLEHIDRLLPYRTGHCLEIDQATRRSLEITRTLREDRREGSLLAVIDRTVTAMGSRLLADWVANPLTQIAAIEQRLDAVAELLDEPALCRDLQFELKGIYDLQRLLARVATGRTNPRDLSFLARRCRLCLVFVSGWKRVGQTACGNCGPTWTCVPNSAMNCWPRCRTSARSSARRRLHPARLPCRPG